VDGVKHLIASVRFEKGANDGPARCDCGWRGRASEFSGHLKSVGQRVLALSEAATGELPDHELASRRRGAEAARRARAAARSR
jgi:hypothetical protein